MDIGTKVRERLPSNARVGKVVDVRPNGVGGHTRVQVEYDHDRPRTSRIWYFERELVVVAAE